MSSKTEFVRRTVEGDTIAMLELPDAVLGYDVQGDGPLAVLIAGAKGDAATYQDFTGCLAGAGYRVVTYDRRGFSRSVATGPPAADRLTSDADDLHRLIEHLGETPAVLFGNSSGALVALRLLAGHPTAARATVVHEPPLVMLLPDVDDWLDRFDAVYEVYRSTGIPAAVHQFASEMFGDTDRRAIHRFTFQRGAGTHRVGNTTFWLEHELRQYPRTAVDTDALTTARASLVVAAGQDSRGHPCYRAGQALADRLLRARPARIRTARAGVRAATWRSAERA